MKTDSRINSSTPVALVDGNIADDAQRDLASAYLDYKGHEPVGIMGLMLQRGERRSHRATIIMVYLRESERGSGLANDLLQAVMSFAKEVGVRQLELNVNHTNNRAIRFYERHGFEMVGKIPAALIDDGHEVDELIMVHR